MGIRHDAVMIFKTEKEAYEQANFWTKEFREYNTVIRAPEQIQKEYSILNHKVYIISNIYDVNTYITDSSRIILG